MKTIFYIFYFSLGTIAHFPLTLQMRSGILLLRFAFHYVHSVMILITTLRLRNCPTMFLY